MFSCEKLWFFKVVVMNHNTQERNFVVKLLLHSKMYVGVSRTVEIKKIPRHHALSRICKTCRQHNVYKIEGKIDCILLTKCFHGSDP